MTPSFRTSYIGRYSLVRFERSADRESSYENAVWPAYALKHRAAVCVRHFLQPHWGLVRPLQSLPAHAAACLDRGPVAEVAVAPETLEAFEG